MQANEDLLLYAAETQHMSKEQRQRHNYEEMERDGKPFENSDRA